MVGWEITQQCNLTCKHCFTAASRRPHNELTTDECKRTIDSMAAIGVGYIGWTGGEPLLRPDLEELTEYAGSKGIRSTITTNGVLLDRKRAESIVASRNRAIQISLDGSTAERNQKMRGATSDEFERILEALDICRELRTRVVLATMIGRENLDDGPEMIRLAKRVGAGSIRFCGYTPIGRGKRGDVLERLGFSSGLAELHRFIETAQNDSEIICEFDPGFGPVPPEYSFHECSAGIDTFYLKANGDVYPCTALTDRRFLVGNIRKQPLEEIWSSDQMCAMSAYPRESIHGDCAGCDNFSNCHGGCRGAAFAHTGDLSASFPVCLYRAATKDSLIR